MKNRIYKLFADCIPVKGFSRSLIYDLTRKNYEFIPNSLYEILSNKFIETDKYYAELDSDSILIFEEYMDFLLKNEYLFEIFSIDELKEYPEIDLSFDYPSKISNAIIDYEGNYELFLNAVLQLDNLNCNFVLIRILSKINLGELHIILKAFDDFGIFSVDIIANFHKDFIDNNILKISKNFARLSTITIYESPRNEINYSQLNNGMGAIIYKQNKYNKNKITNIESEAFFSINIKLFTESLNYNPFFNKKLYIYETGDIKNSPYSKTLFGNIANEKLNVIISNKQFVELWSVKKDDIIICKDCEFRYMCVDNRTPLKMKEKWFFDDLCNYNPYDNQWK